MATTGGSQERETAPAEATPERWRKLWLAAAVYAGCYGIAGFFLTGDPSKASAVGLFVFAVFAILLVAFRRWVDRQRAVSKLYLRSLAVLIVPLAFVGFGVYRTPWNELEEAYRATGSPPTGLDGGREIVLVEPAGEFLVTPHSFKRATAIFADDGVYLALSWPMSWNYDPLWLPAREVSRCAPSGLDTMYTSLALKRLSTKVEVLDPGEDVLRWCRSHQIGDGRG